MDQQGPLFTEIQSNIQQPQKQTAVSGYMCGGEALFAGVNVSRAELIISVHL